MGCLYMGMRKNKEIYLKNRATKAVNLGMPLMCIYKLKITMAIILKKS